MSETLKIISKQYFDIEDLREIFFQTSARKVFVSNEEKELFFYSYLGVYLDQFNEFSQFASIPKIVGYCVGSPVTSNAQLMELQPHLKLFEDLYSSFPAHLHINFLPNYQGQGLGSKLLLAFEQNLCGRNIPGLHIITASNSRNVSFYRRLGFTIEVEREYNGNLLLFMAKKF